MQAEYKAARKLLAPHMILLEFLQSRFQSFRYSDKTLVNVSRRMVLAACAAVRHWRCVQGLELLWACHRPFSRSTHPLAREIRIRFLTFAFCILQCSRVEAVVEYQLRESIYKAAFAWFACRPAYVPLPFIPCLY